MKGPALLGGYLRVCALLFIVCTCRVLGEVSEEMKSKVPLLAKQKKESEFLKQKSGHYQKLVTAMTVHTYHSELIFV